jgi:hypothetical protein
MSSNEVENDLNSNKTVANLLKHIVIQKGKENMLTKILIYSTIFFITLLLYFYLLTYLITYSSNNTCSILLAKYDNLAKSNFSNKDEYTDPNVDNYDIHYLVEQMIYKEFSPTDKKKYLNLPQIFKEKLISDYLIQNI